MNAYQIEQFDALVQVRRHLATLADEPLRRLNQAIAPYLYFRRELDAFLKAHFEAVCTMACYQDRRSACCSKDGIITFFADHVINALAGGTDRLGAMERRLQRENPGAKCVYLTARGCCWSVRPLVCAMFLCDSAQASVFKADTDAESQWRRLQTAAKRFRWPDRPVLFDALELAFIDAGHRSSLMYLNFSPGLLRIKQSAGLPTPASMGRSFGGSSI
ncbi:MAG: hypothetical protein P8010_15970 [Desulfosarcinaceae bacterium]